MNGLIRERFHYFLGAIFVISVLFFPDLSLGGSYPAIQISDLLLPLLLWAVLPFLNNVKNRGFYFSLLIFMGCMLLSMGINGRLWVVQDLFECYKLLKWAVVVLFYSTLSIQHVWQTWVKGLFLGLVAVNLLHYFNVFNFNSLLTSYYHGGVHIEYFGLNSLKHPAAKRMVGFVGNPNVNALVFTLFAIALFPFKWRLRQVIWFLTAVLMVFLCQSKTALLSLIIIMLAIPSLKLASLSLKNWGGIFIGITGMYLLAWGMATSGFKYPLYSNVLFNEGGGQLMQTGSAKGRLEVWHFLGQMILDKPLFGYGGNKAFFYSHKLYAENEFILISWRYGLVGLLAFLWIYLRIWLDFTDDEQRAKNAIQLLSIGALLATSMTNNPLTDRTVCMLFCILLGMGYQRLRNVSLLNQKAKTTKRLLLIGSSNGSAHLKNYYSLIQAYFDEVMIISNRPVDYCKSVTTPFGLKNPFALLRSIKSIKKTIHSFQPDIIHVHQANVYAFATICANKGKTPLVLTTWGSDVLLLPNTNFINRSMVRYNLRHSDYITADASFMGTTITKLIGRTDTVIANFGIDVTLITKEVKKEKFIYSNRMHEPLYNIDAIIEGCAEFLRAHEDWHLVIAGKGSLTEDLQSHAKNVLPKNQYAFIGFVSSEENMSTYQRAQIYLSNPSSDGTAISLLEAMSTGCIPVVSDLPANREWISDGQNGIIIEGNNVSKALIKALELSPTGVAHLNYELVLERASKDSNRKLFYTIYDRCLRV